MAVGKKAISHKGDLPKGTAVSFNYRSAHNIPGTVVGVKKQGTKPATTLYEVQPAKKDVHPGEKVPVTRSGAHLHRRG